MSERRVLESPVPGITLVVDQSGPATAATDVVWLHSEFGPFDDPPLPAEAIADVRMTVVHHPGWGVSDLGGSKLLTRMDEVATLYWWLLDALGIDAAVLAGHGFGATLAVEMAIQQPQRVVEQLLVAPFGLFDVEAPGVDMFGSVIRDLLPAIYREPGGELASTQFPNPTDPYERGLAALRRNEVLGATARYLFPIPDTGIDRRFYRIGEVPTTILWGALDGVLPAVLADHWSAAVPHAEVVVVDDASRMLPYERPEVLATALTSTLARVAR